MELGTGFLLAATKRQFVQEYERKQLLDRIDRDGATVGVSLPEEIEVDGETIALRDVVVTVKGQDDVAPETREEVEELTRKLRRGREERREQIDTGDITLEQGEELATEIIGIDRALNALSRLGTADMEAEMEAAEVADKKRFHAFLRKALGHDDADDREVQP